jgi:hypothetical protein
MDGGVDLTHYRGESIELLFSTDPGPRGDSSYDWAAWSGFHFDDEQMEVKQPFELIYDGEAKVYEYADVVPRAAIFYNADIRNGRDEILRELVDPSLDVFRTVILDSSELNGDQTRAIREINAESPPRADPAKIMSYESRSVLIEAITNRSGILVLNDSDYPGWTVDIDGHPANWVSANYLFRGVLLQPGRHMVRFVYRPKSFYYGVVIASVALLCLLSFSLYQEGQSRPLPSPAKFNDRTSQAPPEITPPRTEVNDTVRNQRT